MDLESMKASHAEGRGEEEEENVDLVKKKSSSAELEMEVRPKFGNYETSQVEGEMRKGPSWRRWNRRAMCTKRCMV
ncbi:hypothetical protein ACFX12_008923 [Malus domestica]